MDGLQGALKTQIISLTARMLKANQYEYNRDLQIECVLLMAQIEALTEEYESRYGKEE